MLRIGDRRHFGGLPIPSADFVLLEIIYEFQQVINAVRRLPGVLAGEGDPDGFAALYLAIVIK